MYEENKCLGQPLGKQSLMTAEDLQRSISNMPSKKRCSMAINRSVNMERIPCFCCLKHRHVSKCGTENLSSKIVKNILSK